MFPALAGRFLTTGPPGKSPSFLKNKTRSNFSPLQEHCAQDRPCTCPGVHQTSMCPDLGFRKHPPETQNRGCSCLPLHHLPLGSWQPWDQKNSLDSFPPRLLPGRNSSRLLGVLSNCCFPRSPNLPLSPNASSQSWTGSSPRPLCAPTAPAGGLVGGYMNG